MGKPHTLSPSVSAGEAENTRFILGPANLALEMSFSTASCPDDAIEAEALLRAAGFVSA